MVAYGAAGHATGWGLGRHTLGSNFFHYIKDPWGSWIEYSSDMDCVTENWQADEWDCPPAVWGPEMPGVPGLTGAEHVAFTVPDLEDAIDFFTAVLGCERLYDMGPFSDPTGTLMTDTVDVHPRAAIDNFAVLRCANGANFELFQYQAPDQVTRWPRMSDHGGSHIAFYVEDMDAALSLLRSHKVRVLGVGKKACFGPEAGEESTFAHFLTPWGQLLEFVSYPHGRAYFSTTERRAWRPTA